MIKYITGDASEPIGTGNKIIVHICNDKGKWGKGFVMALSHKWPWVKEEYINWYQGKLILPFSLGAVQILQVTSEIQVANLIGQHDIKMPGQYYR